jgi:hypothetical protein
MKEDTFRQDNARASDITGANRGHCVESPVNNAKRKN